MADILIHGSGIVAHSMALALAAQKLRVRLSHPPTRLSQDDRAFAITPASRALLEGLGAWPQTGFAAVNAMRIFADGAVAATSTTLNAPSAEQPLAWLTDAAAIADSLKQAVLADSRITVDDSQASSGYSTANQRCALEIICEGKDAPRAAQMRASFVHTPYGQHALAARVRVGKAHGHTAYQWFQEGEILALLPLGASEAGNFMALVWSVSHARAKELHHLQPQELASAVQQATRAELGEVSMHTAAHIWQLRLTKPVRFFGINPDFPAATWLLAGDAAHNIHPLAGLGLNLGLGDVSTLAKVLGKRNAADHWRAVNDPRLLRQYERERQTALSKLALGTDGIFQLFAIKDQPLSSLRQWGVTIFEAATPIKSWLSSQVRHV